MPVQRRKKQKCIDPELGRRVYLQVRERAPNQETLLLSSELEDHVRACQHCADLLPLWIISAQGGLAAAADKLVAEAQRGDPGVLYKRLGSSNAYFRSGSSNSSVGLMVVLREDGSLISVDETTIDKFHELDS